MESNGAGHFTTVATSILKEADQISPEALLSKVTTEFTRRKWIGQQRPKFETPESWSGSLLP